MYNSVEISPEAFILTFDNDGKLYKLFRERCFERLATGK